VAVRRNSSRSAETRGRGRGFFIISGTREERRIVVECYVRDAAVLILDSFTKHVVISRSRLGNVVCYYASYRILLLVDVVGRACVRCWCSPGLRTNVRPIDDLGVVKMTRYSIFISFKEFFVDWDWLGSSRKNTYLTNEIGLDLQGSSRPSLFGWVSGDTRPPLPGHV
jgi:hypothetical protein